MQLDSQLQKAQLQAEQYATEQLALQQKVQESTAGKEDSVCNLTCCAICHEHMDALTRS